MRSSRRGTSAAHVQNVLGFHRRLLGDAVRNRAFQRALRRVVSRGHRVLDIGAGSGVWSVVAAQLGAREVVAVEKEALLIEVIEKLARENGVADRVRVVHGDSRRLDLGRRFDVVVSETVGNEAFDEGIVPLMADARRRLLRRGGVLVPDRLSLHAAPGRRHPLSRKAPGLRQASLDALTIHLPDGFSAREIRLVADPLPLVDVVLGEQDSVDLRHLHANWRLSTQVQRIDGFAVWGVMRLAQAVHLSTLWKTHWHSLWYGIEPVRARGTLGFSLALGRPRLHWKVRWLERGQEREADYSPAFACAALALGLRTRTNQV